MIDIENTGYVDVTELGCMAPDLAHVPAYRRDKGRVYECDNGQGFAFRLVRVGISENFVMYPSGQRDCIREGGKRSRPIPYRISWTAVIDG